MYEEEQDDKIDEGLAQQRNLNGPENYGPRTLQKALIIPQPPISESPFTFKNGFERREDRRMVGPFLVSKSP